MEKKGFTLIELLIVIAILAVLATIIVLVLNPAQLLAEARDSQRLQDLDTMRSAINFVLVRSTTTVSMGSTSNCFIHDGPQTETANCNGRHVVGLAPLVDRTMTAASSRDTTGTGWIPIDSFAAGPPISVLPVDPTNDLTYFYTYLPGSNSTFELNAKMESAQYAEREQNDGGNRNAADATGLYEIGTAPSLSL